MYVEWRSIKMLLIDFINGFYPASNLTNRLNNLFFKNIFVLLEKYIWNILNKNIYVYTYSISKVSGKTYEV